MQSYHWIILALIGLSLITIFLIFYRKRTSQRRILEIMSQKNIEIDYHHFFNHCVFCHQLNQCPCVNCIYLKFCSMCPSTDCVEIFEESFQSDNIKNAKVIPMETYRVYKELKHVKP